MLEIQTQKVRKNAAIKYFCVQCSKQLSNRRYSKCGSCALKGRAPWNKGNKKKNYCIDSDKQLMSLRSKRCNLTCAAKGRNKGKTPSLATRIKLSEALKGSKSHLWRGGTTLLHQQIRSGFEYRNWRISVFIRDNRTCVQCGYKGKNIEADHIKPLALYPELRLEISNGRTLCHDCHTKTDSYFGNFHLNRLRETICH